MRTFFAFALSKEIIEKIDEFYYKNIATVFKNIRKVSRENIHITLKFLGEIGQDVVDVVKQRLLSSSPITNQFEVEIGGIGVFPGCNKANVLWIGVKDNNKNMTLIHDNICKILEEINIKIADTKEFHPHIT
ncbi:MAG: RNA 2',3'-cyclic phosphodiesterase, partial [Planctomycetota bacterium]